MESNFEFTNGQVFYSNLIDAERFAIAWPEVSGWSARRALEQIIHKSFSLHLSLTIPRDFKRKKHNTIGELIHLEDFETLMDETKPGILDVWDSARELANKATHEDANGKKRTEFSDTQAVILLDKLNDILEWYYTNVLDINDEIPAFNKDLLPDKLPEDIVKEEFETRMQKQEKEHQKQLKALREEMESERDRLLAEFQAARKEKDPKPEFTDVGLTEQVGLIWGRVYVNFKYLDNPYYAVKYYQNEGGAKEKLLISKGRYQQSEFFKMFPSQKPGCALNAVLSGTFDELKLVLKFDKRRFGTPSILLEKLIREVKVRMEGKNHQLDAYAQQEELNKQFDFFGSYYKSEGIGFRNLLTIRRKSDIDMNYEALVVMINPGGSYPLDAEDYQDKSPLDQDKTQLVPCNPDDTQYQICRLMNQSNWNHVAVLNLFDICETDSRNVFERYMSDKSLLKESIFHQDRRSEFESLLSELATDAPVILAWGMNDLGFKIKKQIQTNVIASAGRKLFGWTKPGKTYHYYHPYPRGEHNAWIRNDWPNKIHEQLNSTL